MSHSLLLSLAVHRVQKQMPPIIRLLSRTQRQVGIRLGPDRARRILAVFTVLVALAVVLGILVVVPVVAIRQQPDRRIFTIDNDDLGTVLDVLGVARSKALVAGFVPDTDTVFALGRRRGNGTGSGAGAGGGFVVVPAEEGPGVSGRDEGESNGQLHIDTALTIGRLL